MKTDRSHRIWAIVFLGVGVVAFATGCGQANTAGYQQFDESDAQAAGSAEVVELAGQPDQPEFDGDNVENAKTADAVDSNATSPEDAATVAESSVNSTDGDFTVADAATDKEPVGLVENPNKTDTTDELPLIGSDPITSFPPAPNNAEGNPATVVESGTTVTAANNSRANGSGAKPKSIAAREVKLLVKDKKFKTEGPDKALRVSYDDFDLLKILNMEPVTPNAAELMPDWLKSLNGKRVRVRGFMYPPFQETGLRGFVLARDNQICCFGRNPKIYDLVEVTMRDGVTANYIQSRPFDVVGVFRIEAAAEDGELFRLFQIADAVVIDK